VKVDGNDAEKVYEVAREAVERARAGGGPTLIEAETYRMGAHSSSDDPTRYRDQKEVDAWRVRDPLDRLRSRLIEAKQWDEEKDAELKARLLAQVNEAIAQAEALPPPSPETLLEDVYADVPWNIREQRAELAAFLKSQKK
jgi:pyruvate dehydrogenase E1 component alpha subunit/2-oxoisovalerate dehydrogenase E1 component alpha subunit